MLDTKPSISIVIPSHLSIKKAITLFVNCCSQAKDSDEVVVVLDNPKYKDEYLRAQKHTGFRLIVNSTNLGASASRNIGISHANKRIVLLVDSDCEIPDGFVESHREAHTIQDGIVVVGRTQMFNNGKWYSEYILRSTFFCDSFELLMRAPDGSLLFAPTSNLSAPKKLFQKFPFSERFCNSGGEDNLWCLMVREKAKIWKRAMPVKHEIWKPFFKGILLRVFRWGDSEAIVMNECLKIGLNKYIKNDQSQFVNFLFRFGGNNVFDRFVFRLHRLGFLWGCIKIRDFSQMSKYINHQGTNY